MEILAKCVRVRVRRVFLVSEEKSGRGEFVIGGLWCEVKNCDRRVAGDWPGCNYYGFWKWLGYFMRELEGFMDCRSLKK